MLTLIFRFDIQSAKIGKIHVSIVSTPSNNPDPLLKNLLQCEIGHHRWRGDAHFEQFGRLLRGDRVGFCHRRRVRVLRKNRCTKQEHNH